MWFQPIWKALVKLDHFPKVRGENKTHVWNQQQQQGIRNKNKST